MARLTPREMRFLALIYPEGSISVGLTIGMDLRNRGYLQRKGDRYVLTRKGMIAVAALSRTQSTSGSLSAAASGS